MRKPAARAKVARYEPGKPFLSRATIVTAALSFSIAASALVLDPRAEAAFDAPKQLAALIGIVTASIALMCDAQWKVPRWLGGSVLRIAIVSLLALATCGAAFATLASPHRGIALQSIRVSVLFALLLPLGGVSLLKDTHRHTLMTVFIFASLVNAITSILQAMGFQPLPIESIAGRVTSVGLIGNEGYLALLMALLAVSSLGVVRFTSSRRTRIACWGALGLTLIALALTRNVTGWVAFIAGAIPLLWTPTIKYRLRQRPYVIATAGALIVLMTVLPNRGRITSMLSQAHTRDWDSVLSYRLGPWAAAADMFREHPLTGYGPGTFGAEFVPHRLRAEIYWARRFVNPQLASFYAQAHCDYLQALAEVGLPAGLAAICAFGLLMFGLSRRITRDNPTRDDRLRAEATVLLSMLTVGAIGALVWSPLHNPALTVPLLLAAGRGWRLLGDPV